MAKHKYLNKIYARSFQHLILQAMCIASPSSKVKTSDMSVKLDGFTAINSNTLSIDFCDRKCSYEDDCYSKKMLRGHRQSCIPKWEINGQVLSRSIIPFNELPIIKKPLCRINAHGELINYTHLENLMRIIKRNPKTFFGFWTKRYDLIKQYAESNQIPDNVNLIFSNSSYTKPLKEVPKYFHKTFSNVTDSRRSTNCSGKCGECMICYTKSETPHITEELKSSGTGNNNYIGGK